ncbi:ribonucleoside-triphosphate reductase, adenosylcobalamin-dependent [Rhodococcus antarcticus]|uniref:Adenosylcobalamin-dependent ribonucleoside-triphosphate reductase n=1 Tax=Rhodococcus antarcticus TaxID=2987751 RepID=A0ABY6NWH6_9NOCA|nr:ribonucleoside-triphosphate reductase, adenosylcobalamin-dependent [Rhodococcus antarcticus]UZJ23747.1 ribonucleoside-triphosphate reductase, adenosylcobalamin-dependent [Rhodococcus antarcticus]
MNAPTIDIPWGPTGETVYDRTYSRVKANGQRETWPDTVARVAEGNLALVYGERSVWSTNTEAEYDDLARMMLEFKLLPAGRHLWASGVKGRQYLFNCHVSGWGVKLSDHFEFTFLRLMEGGGVGANYSSRFLEPFGAPRRALDVHLVCDPEHPDYAAMVEAGLLSSEFNADWHGAFEVEDSREGWASALVDLLDTYMTDVEVRHSSRVYDVSRVRAKGSRLKTFGGTASGPQPFARMMTEVGSVLNKAHNQVGEWGVTPYLMPTEAMEIDHAIAECVVSGGVRRSARMAICAWDDPFIEEFLSCKADSGKHWTTNISVEIDQDFLDQLSDVDSPAYSLHERVVTAMLTNGEPGYWNSTLSNVGEPNEVTATNPCGEIALEAWENCNLGHVNLDAFAPTTRGEELDVHELALAHRLMARFLIRATYGDVNDAGQAEKLARNRRIGVGHLGVQGFLAKAGVRYSDAPKDTEFSQLLAGLYSVVRQAAHEYAFDLRIPAPVKVTTVAPTGSIAKLPGATEGIHPIYARYFNRRVRFSLTDEAQAAQVAELLAQGHGYELDSYDASGNTGIVVFRTKERLVAEVEALGYTADTVESADEISLEDMLAFQAMYQNYWADNAVSFTVNMPAEDHQEAAMASGEMVPAPTYGYVDEVATTLARYLPHLKGTTLMVDGARPQAPYERITEAEYEAAGVQLIEDGTDEDCANGSCPVR